MPEPKQVDRTTKAVKPDFESGKGYYWMKQIRELEQFGTPLKKWPRKPPRNRAEASFKQQVNQRLSRRNFTVSISFDKDGKIIREEEE